MGLFSGLFGDKPKYEHFGINLDVERIEGLAKKFRNVETFKIGKTTFSEEQKTEILKLVNELNGNIYINNLDEFQNFIPHCPHLQTLPKWSVLEFLECKHYRLEAFLKNNELTQITLNPNAVGDGWDNSIVIKETEELAKYYDRIMQFNKEPYRVKHIKI